MVCVGPSLVSDLAMEVRPGNDPIYRSISREFSHPEDLLRLGGGGSPYQSHGKQQHSPTHYSTHCALPPSLPHHHLSQYFEVDNISVSDLLTALQQFFLSFPAEFSFQNWTVSLLPPPSFPLPLLLVPHRLLLLSLVVVESLSLSSE